MHYSLRNPVLILILTFAAFWLKVSPSCLADESDLGLGMLSVGNGSAELVLYNTQNNQIYELQSTTDLGGSVWHSETLLPGDAPSTFASISIGAFTNFLYFRARAHQPTNGAVWVRLQDGFSRLAASVNRQPQTYSAFFDTMVEIPGPVVSLNLGYDFQDEGLWDIPWDPQNVVAVNCLTDSLTTFCASHNPLATLDLHGLAGLQEIECFQCQYLANVNVTNCPSLSRACFEQCNIEGVLDFTGDTNLADIRGAVNQYTNVVFGGAGPKIWHLCVRDNPQICQNLALTNFYSLRVWLMWNDNQTGAVNSATMPSTQLADVELFGNAFESADFSGQTNLQTLLINDNILTNLVVTGCTNLTTVHAQNNQLTTAAIDSILSDLSVMGLINGYLDVSGNPNPPSSVGYEAIDNLRINLGWTVVVDGYGPPFFQ